MYRDEGLTEWTEIKFKDNQHVIDTISKKPSGLLNILEEHGMLNRKPDDNALVTSFNQTHGQSSIAYVKSRFGGDCAFSIKHFAGDVKYNADGFILKNNDSLQDDLVTLLTLSSNSFLLKITDLSSSTPKPVNNVSPNRKMATSSSVSSKFREQLDNLINTLRSTQPHYIKCIKPNPNKSANLFQNDLVIQQLRYSGVLEVIRIRREGFPIRMKFIEFYDKYIILTMDKEFPKPQDIIKDIDAKEYASYIANTFLSKKIFQIGHSHIFLRDESFEELRVAIGMFLHGRLTRIQSFFRKYYLSKKYRMIKSSAIKLHNLVRMFIAHKRYRVVLNSARIIKWFLYGKKLRSQFLKRYEEIVVTNRQNHAIKVVCTFVWYRLLVSKTRFIYLLMKYSSIIIQKYFRRKSAVKLLMLMKHSIIKIQTYIRMKLIKTKYLIKLKQKKIVKNCVRNWIFGYYIKLVFRSEEVV